MPGNISKDNQAGSLEQETDSREGNNIAIRNQIGGSLTQRVRSKDRLALPGGVVGVGTGAIVAAAVVFIAGYVLKYLRNQ